MNARSLSRIFESLEQIINSLSITPDFIGISETWLKELIIFFVKEEKARLEVEWGFI